MEPVSESGSSSGSPSSSTSSLYGNRNSNNNRTKAKDHSPDNIIIMPPREEEVEEQIEVSLSPVASLEEPLLSPEERTSSSNNNNNNNTASSSSNNDDDDNKNITITVPSLFCCCTRRGQQKTFSMNHNVFLNLVLCALYGVSDSLWSGTVLAAYLKKLGHSHNSWVGNVEAANGLASLFSALPVGYLADHWGRDKVLRVGGVLLVVTALLHAILMEWIGVNDENNNPHGGGHNMEWLLAGIMALWGIGGGIVMGPSQALFADSTPKGKRSQYYMYLFVCFSLSSCIGPLVSIILFQTLGDDWDLYDLRIIIWVGLGMESINGLLMMFFDDRKALKEEDEEDDDEEEEDEQQQQLTDEEQPLSPLQPTVTTTTEDNQDDDEETTQAVDNTTTTTTMDKYKWMIPYIMFLHNLIFALGSGMTVKFFPLFFKDQVGMSPTKVQIVYFIVPLVLASFSGIGQQISTKCHLGRVTTGLMFKASGVALLFSMVIWKNFLDTRPLLLVPIYILRTSLMNASYPLEESILMDNVPKKERGRWKSLESIAIFGWCGSAALGGWTSDHANGDYTYTFFITACIQTFGTIIWCLLWPLVPIQEATDDDDEDEQQGGGPSNYLLLDEATISSDSETAGFFDAVECHSQLPVTSQHATATNTSSLSRDDDGDGDDVNETIQRLQLYSKFPTLNFDDFRRFREMFDDDDEELVQMLQEYVQFRALYELDDPNQFDNFHVDNNDDDDDADAAHWKWAAELAVRKAKTYQGDLLPGVEGGATLPKDRVCNLEQLPQLCFAHKIKTASGRTLPVLTKDGNPIIQYYAGRFDNHNVSSEIHAVTIALYLEQKARELDLDNVNDRGSGKGRGASILMVDARKGKGWPNHSVLAVAGFLKILTKTLCKIHPGRMEKLIIYPVPYAGVYAFKMMKRWLPQEVADNIVLVNGSDAITAPVPKKELSKYVSPEILDHMEMVRRANFE